MLSPGNSEAMKQMKILFILNEAPYGSEKTYNALRLAISLQKNQPDTKISEFLMADAVTAALSAQGTPLGYYNIERMLKSVITRCGQVRHSGENREHGYQSIADCIYCGVRGRTGG